MSEDLEGVAATLVADGKGILAADESVATLTRRFNPLGIKSTEPRGLRAHQGADFHRGPQRHRLYAATAAVHPRRSPG
jgi:fructose-bisphosphate aldolase class 1